MPEPSKVPHKDRWPTGNVTEEHLYQCPRCKYWCAVTAGPVKKVTYCMKCGGLMAPRGIIQKER